MQHTYIPSWLMEPKRDVQNDHSILHGEVYRSLADPDASSTLGLTLFLPLPKSSEFSTWIQCQVIWTSFWNQDMSLSTLCWSFQVHADLNGLPEWSQRICLNYSNANHSSGTPNTAIGLEPQEMFADNNNPILWCLQTSTYVNGKRGTPNQVNDSCTPWAQIP